MGNRASTTNVTLVRTTTYQVATWPVIRFIFMPNYVVWRSSWYWGYYPVPGDPGDLITGTTTTDIITTGTTITTYTTASGPARDIQNYNTYYINIRTQSPRVYSRIKEGSYRETYSLS